ncbi:MAG: hypothetical protein MI862_20515 [Desulfobacterales bacterium]|nr:hypothetical protein [Desulfobacterales bacterium]
MGITNTIAAKRDLSHKRAMTWILLISLFFCELLVYTWVRTESTQMQLRVSEAQKQLIREQAYKKALIVERDRLKSDDRIIRIAKTQLGLTADTSPQTVYLPGDQG